MARSLTARVQLRIHGQVSNPVDLQTPVAPFDLNWVTEFSNGNAADKAEAFWSDQRQLAASATEDLDLAGALTDILGGTLTFTKIKGIFIKALATNVNNVIVGGAAATQFFPMFGAATHTLVLPPGAEVAMMNRSAAGWAVGAGTADLLKFANSAGGTAVDFYIGLLGTTS